MTDKQPPKKQTPDELLDETKSVLIKTRTVTRKVHDAYLYEFGESHTLTDLFDVINSSEQGDVINIMLNNPGGYLDTGIQLISTLESEYAGEVNIHIQAPLYSMASLFAIKMILLGCKVYISDNSYLMFHNYSGGAHGKGNEMFDRFVHEKKWYKGFFERCTIPFLSQEEVNKICNDKDVYITRKDMLKRIRRLSRGSKKSND